MLGNLSDEAIVEVFDDSYFGLEGCYEYRACIYYESGSWNEPVELYCTKQSAELYIDYIDFVFVESFESRLDLLLGDTALQFFFSYFL